MGEPGEQAEGPAPSDRKRVLLLVSPLPFVCFNSLIFSSEYF